MYIGILVVYYRPCVSAPMSRNILMMDATPPTTARDMIKKIAIPIPRATATVSLASASSFTSIC